MEVGWPSELFIIRHAQSAGNVARERALASGSHMIDLAMRDCDVPLSELGERQAAALGTWCARHLEPIDAVITSPYVRAQRDRRRLLRAHVRRGDHCVDRLQVARAGDGGDRAA